VLANVQVSAQTVKHGSFYLKVQQTQQSDHMLVHLLPVLYSYARDQGRTISNSRTGLT
jgi:hypothetical protein